MPGLPDGHELPAIERKTTVSVNMLITLHDELRRIGIERHGGNTSAATVEAILAGLENIRISHRP